MMQRFFVTTLALLGIPALTMAQGSISTQGFGYPPGGLSTRAGAAGGGFAEFDFSTPRNPSSTLGWGRGGLYFQYEPEFRTRDVWSDDRQHDDGAVPDLDGGTATRLARDGDDHGVDTARPHVGDEHSWRPDPRR